MLSSNDAQLYADFQIILKKAIDYVMDKMLVEYKNEIESVVYGAGVTTVYQRTYWFKDSWLVESDTVDRGASGTLYQDPMIMNYNPALGQHGNYLEDLRTVLADILYNGIPPYSKWYTEPRNAWEPLIKSLDTAKLDKWFREGMRLSGIQLVKIK